MSDIPRSGIRGALERVRVGEFVNLAGGDPSFPTPEHICAAAYEASLQGDTHYTHGRGALALREAFAAKLARENGLREVDPETEILVAAGALNALAATFLALLDPGDEVLVPDPGFANYQAQVILAGGRPVPIPLSGPDGFVPSLEAMRTALTAQSRAIVINSPANPTGAVYPASALQTIASFAAEHDLIVVSDEAYEHLVYPPATHVSVARFAEARDRTVSIFSLSKTYAMTGWRVGFAVAPPQLSEEIAKVLEHVIGCASSVSQAAGLAGLNGPFEPVSQMIAVYERRRQLVIDTFDGLPDVRLVPPLGAFYAFPDVGEPGEEVAERLANEDGVLVVPGSAFGAQGRNHIRLSFAGAEASLAEGLRRLRAGLQQ
jgi:aspartate/methionine/tyrosine aminotransferase